MYFHPGDTVVVAGMGLGTVARIAPASGHLPERYVIETSIGTTELPLTIGPPKLRTPATERVAREALQILTTQQKSLPRFAHKQTRYISQLLSANDLRKTALLLRDLYVSYGAERSQTKLDHYERTLSLMASELAYICNRPLQGMRGLIEATIEHRQVPPELKTP